MKRDDIVLPEKQASVERFYKSFNSSMKIDSLDIQHSLPKAYPQDPHNPENFDVSYHMLKYCLGVPDLKPKVIDWRDGGLLTRFPQAEFVDLSDVPSHDLNDAGF